MTVETLSFFNPRQINIILVPQTSKVYQHIKKRMTYEDELVMYYAGGLDSLAAMDYIACITKQMIIVNREMLGATSNVKQFYYADITSMTTERTSKSDDLLIAVIDSALTIALKGCNLIIMVAGAKDKISTLYTIKRKEPEGKPTSNNLLVVDMTTNYLLNNLFHGGLWNYYIL